MTSTANGIICLPYSLTACKQSSCVLLRMYIITQKQRCLSTLPPTHIKSITTTTKKKNCMAGGLRLGNEWGAAYLFICSGNGINRCSFGISNFWPISEFHCPHKGQSSLLISPEPTPPEMFKFILDH